ncbi:MAG: ATP/GTP-binding protein [Nitrososphaeraceae archaeon]
MDAIFITGTAGSGKSLLASRLLKSQKDNDIFSIVLNLDPGALNLPYAPDVDVRDYVDVQALMETYNLGPNGSLLIASDMIAMKLDEIQTEIDNINPDCVIVDTAGQIELFAFRASGMYFVSNFHVDNRAMIFTFDGMLVSSPINYVAVLLLASSIKLRLQTSQVNVLTKRDLIVERLKSILEWSSSYTALESALDNEKDTQSSLLSKDLARAIAKSGLMEDLIAVSSLTTSGMVNLSASLARILKQGEDMGA